MNTNLENILAKIPEFEEFLKIVEKIRDLSYQKLLLERSIKSKEAEIFREAITNTLYFINGKPPAISFVDSAFKPDGFNGELVEPRKELAKVTSELDHAKLELEVYNSMLEVFRTISANERRTIG